MEVMDHLVSVDDTRRMCGGVSRATIDRWIKSGVLHPVELPVGRGETERFGRVLFRESKIRALIGAST